MRTILRTLATMSVLAVAPIAAVADDIPSWTITLRPGDFVIGASLAQLHTRRAWTSGFDDKQGGFEIALRKTSVAIPAPQCRIDYLVLTIPFYYPENPKQASVAERRTVYDALVALQARGSGTVTVHVEAPEPIGRRGPRGGALTACNLYFAFPPVVRVSAPGG